MMKVRQTNVRFIGILRGRPAAPDEEQKTAFKQQNNLMTHRGPDDEGYYHDAYVSFGFRRLSIIDIDSGQQPLSCDSETIWLLFNGEIYNYVELRDELAAEGYQFETESDTEVIAALFKNTGKRHLSICAACFPFFFGTRNRKHCTVHAIHSVLSRCFTGKQMKEQLSHLKRKVSPL